MNKEYTKCLRIVSDDARAATVYFNRGISYKQLGNYEDAIADYTRSIRIDPDNANTYRDRGVAKEDAGLNYCGDYKSACSLGHNNCCEWYDDQCR